MRRIVFLLLAALSPSLVAAQESPAIRPEKAMALFNGRDFAGLYVYLKETGREDPRKVFRVEDGMICVSGVTPGYLATEQAYRDYHLTVEYKWGRKPEGEKYVRNSGLLLHATGPDGASSGGWPTCIECQLAQGCVGDLIVIRGKDAAGKTVPATITCETTLAADKKTRWQKGGAKTVYSGKQFWWSKHDPEFKELIDTRGREDVESPLGEWTRVEVVAKGASLSIRVNGQTVNECFDAMPASGKILLQSEGAEVWFRKFEIKPAE